MAEKHAKRKLAAILNADVVGYSRLMEDDEEATVRTITAYREMMVSKIQSFNGRVVDAKGDNLLAEFSSVVDALRCSVEIQKELETRNADLAENRKMAFRIGVNLGDVIEEDETIYGDGVNVAARLEGLAESGGICISGTAFDQIGKKLPLGYEFLGERTVKNIEKPIRAYRVLMEPEHVGKVIGVEPPRPGKWPRTAIAVVVVLIIVAAVLLIWNFYFRTDFEPASVEAMAFPLPDKPSIAVLPFDNMSGDPKQEYLCDGITEAIITALASVPNLFVIARNSTFVYKGEPVEVKQVAEDLGVQYVLEGSVAKSGDRIRITAQLVDALKGRHLWAKSYDRNLEDIFDLEDEITMKIITEIRVKLGTPGARGDPPCTTNLKAYLKYLEALRHFQLFNKEDNLAAQRLAEEAVELEPKYSCAYSLLGTTYAMEVWFGSSASPKQSIKKAKENIDKAIALNPSRSGPHSMMALVLRTIGQYDKAVVQAEKAISIEPDSMFSLRELAECLKFAGRCEEAIPLYEKVIRHDPFSTANYSMLGSCYLKTGQYEKAIRICKRATERNPKDLFAHLCLALTYSVEGRYEEARAVGKEILRIDPNFSVKTFAERIKFKKKEDKERYLELLNNAGLK